jgi:hypothetical protein
MEPLSCVSTRLSPNNELTLTTTVVNFIQRPLPTSGPFPAAGAAGAGQPGALGMGQQASSGLVQFNQFFSYVMPMIGKSSASIQHELH